jgi:chemotaxis protein histidine kinase CheA
MAATEDQFQEEVLKLFAEEGIEWIGQIKTALGELEKGAPPDREPKLYSIVISSLTNLMGSAATVDLAALQKLALAMIPLLQAMQSKKLAPKPEHFATIRQGLALLASAVQVLDMAESKTVVIVNLESIMQLQAEHIQRVSSKLQGVAPSPPKEDAFKERNFLAMVVEALLDLKHARPSSLEPSRNLIEFVLRRLHRMLDQETAGITAATISSLLHQIEGLDAHFLGEIQGRLTTVTKVLKALKSSGGSSEVQKRNLQDSLREISFLYEAARDVGAVAIAQFLHGLETLLLEVVYKNVALSSQRVDGVAARVEAIITMAKQWVEMGRAEKAAIEKALSALLDANLAHK